MRTLVAAGEPDEPVRPRIAVTVGGGQNWPTSAAASATARLPACGPAGSAGWVTCTWTAQPAARTGHS